MIVIMVLCAIQQGGAPESIICGSLPAWQAACEAAVPGAGCPRFDNPHRGSIPFTAPKHSMGHSSALHVVAHVQGYIPIYTTPEVII